MREVDDDFFVDFVVYAAEADALHLDDLAYFEPHEERLANAVHFLVRGHYFYGTVGF